MSVNLEKMPKLGFGMMRLPEKDGEIVIDQVCRMVDMYMEAGLNYFDTAYPYHHGRSEVAVGEALVKRYPRDSYTLATKLMVQPTGVDEEQAKAEIKTSLERAGVEYFDYYLVLKKKAEGKVRHIGFSFHGSPKLLIDVLDRYPEMEFVQIQLNYADWENPVVRSGELYEILKERNIPMIIMEPVKGGFLASMKPEMEEKFKKLRPDASIASWALRFVGSLPGVMTILSGMSDENQMLDNINTFRSFEPLSAEEESAVEEVRQMIMEAPVIGCTACRYCVDGCPMSISIPDVFRAVNTLRLYADDGFRPKAFYRGLPDKHGKASDCIACGQCEGACPQHLPIIELMREASKLLDA